MTSPQHSLNLVSFNCRGWNLGQLSVKDLLRSHDICFIQEHWLLQDQLGLLNVNSDFLSIGVSGMDSSKLLLGRPYGGCAILYKRSLLPHISKLDSTSKRFCSLIIRDCNGSTTLLMCVYLPYSDGSNESSNDFLVTLGEIEGFIDRHSFDNIIIGGDFNVDFNRTNINRQHLLNFMIDLDLVSADQSASSHITHTYMRDDGLVSSWPDHFLCNRSFARSLTNIHCLDMGSNLSDHSPLACSLSIDTSCVPSFTPASSTPAQPRIAWHKVTDNDLASYCEMVSNLLPNFPESLMHCSDPTCSIHCSVLDSYCVEFARCLHVCALKTLPLVSMSSTVPGWNNSNARLLKKKANFWHAMWLQAGRPTAGVLHQIKKSARSRYKYEVRRLKRREQHIRREKMAAALASSNSSNFWQLVHRVNRSKKSSAACYIDGTSGAGNISSLFSSKLRSILNLQDASDRDSLLSSLEKSLSSSEVESIFISEECVIEAFSHLKCGKSDGTALISNHLIHSLPAISSVLSLLFTAILRHGYMPTHLRDCTLVPIPKGSKDPSSSDNYRPIALAPTLSKAFEWCILLRYQSHFQTSELQFGFKPKMSTTLCTGMVKNIAARYMFEGSSVFACFLDASKAFDLVNHEILFNRLLDKGLPIHLTRFLLSWYKDQPNLVKDTPVNPGHVHSHAPKGTRTSHPILAMSRISGHEGHIVMSGIMS